MGYFGHMKVNLLNFSNILYEPEKWYRIDLLLDWDLNDAAVFVDGQFQQKTKFYSYERDEIKKCVEPFVNALLLYNLTPGVQSSLKDIRLCDTLCSPLDSN